MKENTGVARQKELRIGEGALANNSDLLGIAIRFEIKVAVKRADMHCWKILG